MARKANTLCRDVPVYALVESAVLDGMMVWDDETGDYSVTRPMVYGWMDDIIAGVCRLSDRTGCKNELRYRLLLELLCDMPLNVSIDTRWIASRLGVHERTARRYVVGLSIVLMVLRRIVVPDSQADYVICTDKLAGVMQRLR